LNLSSNSEDSENQDDCDHSSDDFECRWDFECRCILQIDRILPFSIYDCLFEHPIEIIVSILAFPFEDPTSIRLLRFLPFFSSIPPLSDCFDFRFSEVFSIVSIFTPALQLHVGKVQT